MSTQKDASTRRVVVLGGTGRVGEGVVREWASAGAEVIVPSRTDKRAAELHALLEGAEGADRVKTIVGDYTDFATAATMADRIGEEIGEATDVVAAIGGWWQGAPLWEVTEEVFQRYFVDLTTAHFANIKTWIPRLDEKGSYQLILGGSAYTPVPGASVINMEQAALLMMHQVIAAEAGDQRRIFSAILGPVSTRGRHWVDPTWVTAADVGQVTVAQGVSDAPSAAVNVRTKDDAVQRISEVSGGDVESPSADETAEATTGEATEATNRRSG